MSISSITTDNTLAQLQTAQQDLQKLQPGSQLNGQQTFAQLLQDKQNPAQPQATPQGQAHHHHHHHHASGSQQANSGQSSTTGSSQATAQNILTSALTGVSQGQSSNTANS